MGNCRICAHKANEVLNLGMQPFANKYPKNKTEFELEVKLEMKIEFCQNCKSAQIASLVDRNLMFEDYYYLSSVNTELKKHFRNFATSKLINAKFVLDIGSNDGILLRPLNQLGIKCVGVDPSKNVARIANNEGLKTIVSFFDDKCADLILKNYGYPDNIVASSVFTHIENPNKFIKDLKSISTDKTSIYVEIEYLSSLITKLQFERFYFDRPHYYSVHSMKQLFLKNGFILTDVEKIKTHGGSIRLKFNTLESNVLISSSVKDYLQNEISELSISNVLKFVEESTW